MRLVATLTTGHDVEILCDDEVLANASPRELAEDLDEHRWIETRAAGWIRPASIIALRLEDA